MGVIEGRLEVCDRCGKSRFAKVTGEVNRDGGFTHYKTYDEHFTKHDGKLLCPECSKKWVELKNEFFKEVKND